MLKGPLTSEHLKHFYTLGAFPMADSGGQIRLYEARRRALFPVAGIRLPRSLRRTIRQQRFEIRFDTSYRAVMLGCMRPDGSWINQAIVEAYTQAFAEGWGHCSECWRDGAMAGGVYGLAIGSAFFAESMFHRETDASKVALWALVERCRELGFTLFDAQIMNPHLASLGAYEVSRDEYHRLLDEALGRTTEWGL